MLIPSLKVLAEIQNFNQGLASSNVFWKMIRPNNQKEYHLFLQVEGRTNEETVLLSSDLWRIAGNYVNELALNDKGTFNPETSCETILKLFNDYFTSWAEKSQIDNWNLLNIFFGVATPQALYFARIGNSRAFLLRSGQVINADENLESQRSPHFSLPFSEIAGGIIKTGDRILIASPSLMQFLSWEEILSLITSPQREIAVKNIKKSVEALKSPINASFLLGDIAYREEGENYSNLNMEENGSKIRFSQVGDVMFYEFNPLIKYEPPKVKSKASYLPWIEIVKALKQPIKKSFSKISSLGWILEPIKKKIGSLSASKKITLSASFITFLVFLGYLGYTFLNKPEPTPPKKDYEGILKEAEKSKEEAESALIYKDQEKARKEFIQVSELLKQVSESGEFGIRAMKMKQEIDERLAALENAQFISQAEKVWDLPQGEEKLEHLFMTPAKDIIAASRKNVWQINISSAEKRSEKLKSSFEDLGENSWLVSPKNNPLLIAGEKNNYFIIDTKNKEVTPPKTLEGSKNNFKACAAFNASLYFWESEENQIKQYNFENNTLNFNRNWLKDDFKDDPVVDLAVDGSIFCVTKKGRIMRLSSGKKTDWKTGELSNPLEGEKFKLYTLTEFKNLYLLDSLKKRIIIFSKESGELLGQIQNPSIEKSTDFTVDEAKKEIYFVIPEAVMKLTFDLTEKST